jgi:chemotaxis signal transduction protein
MGERFIAFTRLPKSQPLNSENKGFVERRLRHPSQPVICFQLKGENLAIKIAEVTETT